ncbi:hypothetical protein HDV03_002513 [Kappamyces sp. JEL0829]|nr:hypothetical protein HDV03_002513 [Kappamyces sp. JEL0829]
MPENDEPHPKAAEILKQISSGNTAGLTSLDFTGCGLGAFPESLLALAPQITSLNFGGCSMSTLPAEMSQFVSLRILFFAGNKFAEIPSVLGSLPSLFMLSFKSNQVASVPEASLSDSIGWLILTDNKIRQLPRSIGRLSRLQKCMLSSNLLAELPSEMGNCKSLELLRLADNRFSAMPDWLLSLPRLFWLAFSGNPLIASDAAAETETAVIDYRDLQMGEILGQVYKAFYQPANQDVAVKLFKGQSTSDGLPQDEMKAMQASGSHPHAIQVLGRLTNAPTANGVEQLGLVLPLIPPHFGILGNPPSFQTISRDTYPEGTVFALDVIAKIALGISSVVGHLHRLGLTHGDLYAHNILISPLADHHAYLTDYGAAWSFSLLPDNMQKLIQQLEAGAFGCLLEDLLQRLDEHTVAASGRPKLQALRDLQIKCSSPAVASRPLFSEIAEVLALF